MIKHRFMKIDAFQRCLHIQVRSSFHYYSQACQVSVFMWALSFSPGMSHAVWTGKPVLRVLWGKPALQCALRKACPTVCSEESLSYSVLRGKLALQCAQKKAWPTVCLGSHRPPQSCWQCDICWTTNISGLIKQILINGNSDLRESLIFKLDRKLSLLNPLSAASYLQTIQN